MVSSDDFSAGALDASVWRVEGPAGVSAGLGVAGSEGYLELVTPDGNYDVWRTNNGARVLQDVADGDFSVRTRFLTTPTERFQMQGLLIEQDAGTWLRFDVHSTGSGLNIFAGVTENGSSSSRLNKTIAQDAAAYLRLDRTGDTWTFEHSADGLTWTTAISFDYALAVTAAGVFAGNTALAAGYVARVDYFEVAGDPIVDEDGTVVPPANRAPVATDDALDAAAGTVLTIDVAADLLSDDTDPDGDALTLAGLGAPAHGTLQNLGDGTLAYTPNPGFEGTDSFTYTVTDGDLSDTAVVTVAVAGAGGGPGDGAPVSDDFSAGALDASVWRVEGPAGVSAGLGVAGSEGYLELVTPDGNYDVWRTNNGARVLQDVADGDFSVRTRFLTTPTERFQMQGLLIEQDAGTWLRFDVHSTGSGLNIFAGVTENGSSSSRLNKTIAQDAAAYLRLDRTGDTWTFEHSADGLTWTTAISFDYALAVTAAGVFAGNTALAAGYVARVDYFEVAGDPIVDEDGTVVPPANRAPVATDDALDAAAGTVLTIDVAADLLSDDTDPDGDALTLAGLGAPAHGTLQNLGDGTLAYTPNPGFEGTDSFTYTVTDGDLSDTAVVTVAVAGAGGGPGDGAPVSDDFSAGALDASVWRVEGPAGVSAGLGVAGSEGYLELVTPDGNYDVWRTNNGARVLQDVADGDFSVRTRFLTTPTERFQMQGLLIEQDAGTWLRFDVHSTGSGLNIFAGVTENGSSSSRLNKTIAQDAAAYLRLDRTGDTWTFEHSADGLTWTTAISFDYALAVTAAGVFAGNTALAAGYVARVDYFEVAGDPIVDEDGTVVPPANRAPVATDDALDAAAGTVLTIDVAADLLSDDTDPDGDALTLAGLGAPAHGTLQNLGDGTLAYTPNPGFEGTDSFTYTVTDGDLSDTAVVTVAVAGAGGEKIDVWYGDTQSFGSRGVVQEWVNILGDVNTTGLTGLRYRLNGSPERVLSIGPDNARLEKPGDFNIDIAYTELDASSVDDIVTIIARYADGSTETRDVTVDYEGGRHWSPNYAIDWSEVTDIQNAVQVIDGHWEITSEGLRAKELGYDRFVAMGDDSWDFYEARLSVTPNDFSPSFGLFGFGLWWNGHTDDPVAGYQPKTGWNPSEWLFYNGNGKDFTPHFELYRNIAQQNYTLAEDTRYNFVIRVEQAGQIDRAYQMKVWKEGTPEPTDWLLNHVIAYDAPATGAFALLTHRYDVTFHDVAITEITGSDILKGGPGDDVLLAVDSSLTAPGRGELDVIVGGAGADVFVFGEGGLAFYDDGDPTSKGADDYAYVWDFGAEDAIRLAGSSEGYALSSDASELPEGTAVWRLGAPGEEDELIGVIRGVYGLALTGDEFLYSGFA